MLCREPVKKLSRQTTSQPSFSRRSHKCDPTKPAPPVTSTRLIFPPRLIEPSAEAHVPLRMVNCELMCQRDCSPARSVSRHNQYLFRSRLKGIARHYLDLPHT